MKHCKFSRNCHLKWLRWGYLVKAHFYVVLQSVLIGWNFASAFPKTRLLLDISPLFLTFGIQFTFFSAFFRVRFCLSKSEKVTKMWRFTPTVKLTPFNFRFTEKFCRKLIREGFKRKEQKKVFGEIIFSKIFWKAFFSRKWLFVHDSNKNECEWLDYLYNYRK